MADESLRELLLRADATVMPRVGSASETVAGVRRRRVVQRRVRVGASAVAVCVVASVAMMTSSRSDQPAAPLADAGQHTMKHELAAMQVDARVHAATAEALWTKARARRAVARGDAVADPLAEVRFQRDRAAMTLVYQAERFSRDAHQNNRAIAGYRKVIELFPGSSWADVARQRLREIESRSEV